MSRSPKTRARLERLLDVRVGKRKTEGKRPLSILRKSDVVKRDGTISRAAAQKLRRLESKIKRAGLGNYLASQDYQIYTPKSEARRKELRSLVPHEVQKLELPFLVIRTGQRTAESGMTRIPNRITRVRKTKHGAAVQLDSGRTVHFLDVTAKEYVRDPGALHRKVAQLARTMRRPQVNMRVGFSIIQNAYTPGQLPFALDELARAYPSGTSYGDFGDFFEGITIQDAGR